MHGDQERAADQLAAALTAVVLPVAQSANRVTTTAATPDQVELVAELGALTRQIVEHNRRVMAREPVNWSALADRLGTLTRECRRQVTIELNDVGDSGSR